MPVFTKVCTVCLTSKTYDNYYNSKATKDGKSYRCKNCDKSAGTLYRKLHKERDRTNRKWERLNRLYGLSKEQYLNLWESQSGKCAICDNTLSEGWTKRQDKFRAVVDHCHNTRKVRGLLCTMCNKGVGLLGDTSNLVYKAYEYLKNAEVH